MILQDQLQPLKERFASAETVFILLGPRVNFDLASSASSMLLAFQQAGKSVTLATDAQIPQEFLQIPGMNQVKYEIGNRNLVVSFPYQEGNVEKVSYTISEDNTAFNLVIVPKKNKEPLQPSQVTYSYSGAEADIVFILGATQFEELGELYESEKELFSSAFTVSMNVNEVAPFAQMTLDTTDQSSMAEGVVALLTGLGIEPQGDVATNLLSSIEQATNRFQSFGASPETFEIAARLMRNGARRVVRQYPAPQPGFMNGNGNGNFAQAMNRQPAPQIIQQPPVSPAPLRVSQNEIQMNQANQQPNGSQQKTPPPDEWLKPKVFTGASRV